MRIAIVAFAIAGVCGGAAAAQTAAPGPTPTTSPLLVHPPPPPAKGTPPAAKVDVPTDETAMGRYASVWPRAAYEARIGGSVMLSCGIDRYGLAEKCEVASETPAGRGFGRAALLLRPTFKLAARDESGPILSTMLIAVDFKPPDLQVDVLGDSGGQGAIADCGGLGKPCPELLIRGNPLPRRNVTMLDTPVWTAAATFEDLARAYPARGGGAEGYAVAHCEVQRSGALAACQITKEDPEKHGFGDATIALARRFRLDPAVPAARPHDDLWVDVPIRFPPPDAAPERAVASPTWVAAFDPDAAPKLFPPEAAARGVTSGRGVARCVVAPGGALTDCAPQPADPDGLGFSEAAVKLAATLRMNPWTPAAAPVDGAVVDVAVRLNLKAQ